jgi:hypothetical protein
MFPVTRAPRTSFTATIRDPFPNMTPPVIGYAPTLRADPATNKVNLQVGLAWTRFDIKLFVNNALNSGARNC